MSSPPNRLPFVLGLLLVAGGFAAIAAGWYQAGRQELEAGQLPYLISGGFGGVGLLLLGAAAIVASVVQRALWEQRASIDELGRNIARLAEAGERRAETGEQALSAEFVDDVPEPGRATRKSSRSRRVASR